MLDGVIMMTIDKLIQVIAYSLTANYTLHIMHPEYGTRSHDSVTMLRDHLLGLSALDRWNRMALLGVCSL